MLIGVGSDVSAFLESNYEKFMYYGNEVENVTPMDSYLYGRCYTVVLNNTKAARERLRIYFKFIPK